MAKHSGFTLLEVLVVLLLLSGTVLGSLAVFSHCQNITESSSYLGLALNACQAELEELRHYNFASIATDYAPGGNPGNTFPGPQILPSSMGTINIDNTNPNLLRVTVSLCWQQGKNRIIGEDLNLDGNIDAGEDLDQDGILDSPAEVVTLIAER